MTDARLFPEPTDPPEPPPARAVPGVLPYEAIVGMVKGGEIFAPIGIDTKQYQPASFDLRLGKWAYRVRASFLPGRDATVMEKVKLMDGEPAINLAEGAVLERGQVYVVELLESVHLPRAVWALANPKSSTGRLDVLTRLIVDQGTAFDEIRAGYSGRLYVEVAPQTFPIVVRQGSRLNQIRFLRGISDRRVPTVPIGDLIDRYERGHLVHLPGGARPAREGVRDGLVPVTIDLKGTRPGSIVGYRAKRHTPKIDVDAVRAYNPFEFWEPIEGGSSLILDPDEFYILATREEVGVPVDWAAEMVPYHTRSGEYRVHYAGFFDPGFGWDKEARLARGSKAVLEVRSHEIPFILEHEQIVGWLRYERMATPPLHTYGEGLKSNYQNQALALSKHFLVR